MQNLIISAQLINRVRSYIIKEINSLRRKIGLIKISRICLGLMLIFIEHIRGLSSKKSSEFLFPKIENLRKMVRNFTSRAWTVINRLLWTILPNRRKISCHNGHSTFRLRDYDSKFRLSLRTAICLKMAHRRDKRARRICRCFIVVPSRS